MAGIYYQVYKDGAGNLKVDPTDTIPLAPGQSRIVLSSHIPTWYLAGGGSSSFGQELWTRDVAKIAGSAAAGGNIQVEVAPQVAAPAARKPMLYCVVPYADSILNPPGGGAPPPRTKVDLTKADFNGVDIVISFKDMGPDPGALPNPFTLMARTYTIQLVGSPERVQITDAGGAVVTLPIHLYSRDVVIFERQSTTKRILVQNDTPGDPPVIFAVGDTATPGGNRRLVSLSAPVQSGANIVMSFQDRGGGDGGPPPN